MNSNEPNSQRNLLLAVVLSMAVLAAWQIFYAGPMMREQQERHKRETQETQTGPGPAGTAQPGEAIPATGVPGLAFPTREAALAATARVPIETPLLKGSISLTGGRIDDLVLKDYHVRLDPQSPSVVLFSPPGGPDAYFAEHGWDATGAGAKPVPGKDTVWRVETGSTLAPAAPVTLAWDNGQGLVFRRTIAVDDNYMFTISDEVLNKSADPVTLFPRASIWRYGKPKVEGYFIQHEGLIGVAGDGLEEIDYAEALEEDGVQTFENRTGGWLGITDKYWAAVVIPPQQAVYNARLGGTPARAGEKESFRATYALPSVVAAPGGTAKSEGRVFAGAKKVHLVDAYAENLGIEQFSSLIDWGWFYFLTIPLFYLIDWLYKLFGNFGVAILAVTVIVKAAFFPLANKSYESMAKMKKLQPEMEKLRERFKDDKARQQQELMALYQKEKINPLAGCLPILLQIPVFFALYKVLFISIDMRHAPFFGWIQDLSAPDPTSVFTLFGLLPIPAIESYLLGYTLGAWPLLMGITMWLQMQLNPPQPDPTQQMIFNWMPLLFMFLLAYFPAGLVIYWTWNNILSLAQQYYIMKRQGADVPLLANVQRTLGAVTRLPVRGMIDKARTFGAKPNPASPGTNPEPTPPAADAPVKRLEVIQPEMTREQALGVLGLTANASRKQIEAAHRRRSKRDRQATNGSGQSRPKAEIDKARDVLLDR